MIDRSQDEWEYQDLGDGYAFRVTRGFRGYDYVEQVLVLDTALHKYQHDVEGLVAEALLFAQERLDAYCPLDLPSHQISSQIHP